MSHPAPHTRQHPRECPDGGTTAAQGAEQAEFARLLAGHAGRLALRITLDKWDAATARFAERFPLAYSHGSASASSDPVPLDGSAFSKGALWQEAAWECFGVVAERPFAVGEGA